jgi:hypothetical protein
LFILIYFDLFVLLLSFCQLTPGGCRRPPPPVRPAFPVPVAVLVAVLLRVPVLRNERGWCSGGGASLTTPPNQRTDREQVHKKNMWLLVLLAVAGLVVFLTLLTLWLYYEKRYVTSFCFII